jgi:hypothetical protein
VFIFIFFRINATVLGSKHVEEEAGEEGPKEGETVAHTEVTVTELPEAEQQNDILPVEGAKGEEEKTVQ